MGAAAAASSLLRNRADLGSRRWPESGSGIPSTSRIAERRQAQILTRSCSRLLSGTELTRRPGRHIRSRDKVKKNAGDATSQMSEE